MRIELQWAFTEEDMRRGPCAICAAEFKPCAVIIRCDPHGEEACEECLRALSGRKTTLPGAPWPRWEEYEALVKSHPEPMFSSQEELEASGGDDMDEPWPAYDASWLWRVPEEDVVHITPTVIYRFDRERRAFMGAVVEDPEKGRALVVFRSEEEAEKYRSTTGNHPEAEGFKAVNVGHEELAGLIEMHGCTHVAMPEPWTGEASVDFFKAADYVEMLRESLPA